MGALIGGCLIAAAIIFEVERNIAPILLRIARSLDPEGKYIYDTEDE